MANVLSPAVSSQGAISGASALLGTADSTIVDVLAALGFSAVGLLLLLGLALLFSAYLRITTIIAVLRAGFGIYGIPSVFVCTAVSLGLSCFLMYGTVESAREAALSAVQERSLSLSSTEGQAAALNAAAESWKQFVLARSAPAQVERFRALARELAVQDRSLRASASGTDQFDELSADVDPGARRPTSRQDTASVVSGSANPPEVPISWQVAAPAFVVTELAAAFRAGATILLPFLVLDLLVSLLLAAVGLESISATQVSLPLKLLLFVLVDGWTLITGSIVQGYM